MRRGSWKRLAAAVLAAACVMSGSVTALAAGWTQNETGWWYEREDGSYPVNTWWQDEDGMWYLFDEDGYIYSGCYREVDGVLYPFLSNGMWAGYALADIAQGSWNGAVYSNPWSGLSVTVPEGTSFSYDLDPGMLAGGILEEFSCTLPGSLGASVELYYQDISALSVTDEQYISILALAMAGIGLEVEGSSQVNLGGKGYTKVSAGLSGAFFMDIYFRRVGHYIENIAAMYAVGDKPAMDALVGSIR